MYLKKVIIENSGPIRQIDLSLNFTSDGLPKPLILVGANGGGKTNFLSLIVDALFEGAAIHYEDVLPSRGVGRAWFRMVGGRTSTIGTNGGFSILQFDDVGSPRLYIEKSGNVDVNEVKLRLKKDFISDIHWPTEGSYKNISIPNERSRDIYQSGVYAYFPSSRSEVPYWLNREAIHSAEFDVAPKFSNRLHKPIYVERGLDSFKQWVMGVISDSRADIGINFADGSPKVLITSDVHSSLIAGSALRICNNIIKKILNDDHVRFVWLGRNSIDKVSIARGNDIIFPSLDSLSSGQAILLSMFGSILKYGDNSSGKSILNLGEIEGICVIDEIDSHIHIELQNKVIPSLIKMFPKIQFIISSHSPIFVLGMENEFNAEGVQVIEMPYGNPVGAETYTEFGRAFEALVATNAFTDKIISELRSTGKPIIYVEGETDAPYIKRAIALLGKNELLEKCDVEWIGSKDENGQGFHTGKDALKHTQSVLRANPNLSSRNILLLHDNDSNAPDSDYRGFSVRKLPLNNNNQKIRAGIENLLSEDCIKDEFYQVKETKKANGDINTSKTLRKAELCEEICKNGTPENFKEFGAAIHIIEEFLKKVGVC